MAKKHKPQLPKRPSRPAAPSDPAERLREVLRVLRRGDTDVALRMAGQALEAARSGHDGLSPAFAEAARQLVAESHFRAAARATGLDVRLRHLDEALAHAPELSKLHLHRGVTLWQLGRLPEAIPELDLVFEREPGRPWLAYLRQLARLAAGRPWDTAGLSPAEANTLSVVERLLEGKNAAAGTLPAPLLGSGVGMWQGLLDMRADAAAAPVAVLKQAADTNARKPVSRLLRYYQGVAAMRADDRTTAANAWLAARQAGLQTSWLKQNETTLLQQGLYEMASAGCWQDVVNAARRLPPGDADRAVTELSGLARVHLGYEAAQAGRWSTAVQHWEAAKPDYGSRHLAQNLALAEEALGHWAQAAEAWRDMVRRRPRKAGHRDYLSDAQVAAIWDHIAECYQRAGEGDEAVATLKNAARYAPASADQRLKLVDALLSEEREEAARNELDRILEQDPQHEGALMRLGSLYKRWWGGDDMSIWRRVLAVNPQNTEAREELAAAYLERVSEDHGNPRRFLFFGPRVPTNDIKLLKEGLAELPGHPKLLVRLGGLYAEAKMYPEARTTLLEAYAAAPQNVEIVGDVLHELLHANARDEVSRLLPQVRQIPGLLPAFWIDQSTMALNCKLGQDSARVFFDEALQLAGQPWVEDSRAGITLSIFEAAAAVGENKLADFYAQQVRAEAPASGAAEYLDARRLFMEQNDRQGALKLLRKAIRNARAAHDAGVLKMAESVEASLTNPGLSRDLLRLLETME